MEFTITLIHTGDADLVYGSYNTTEQNTTTGTTANLYAVSGTAISDGGAGAALTNIMGVYGATSMQDATPVTNSHAGSFLNNSTSTRTGATSNTYGVKSEIQNRFNLCFYKFICWTFFYRFKCYLYSYE